MADNETMVYAIMGSERKIKAFPLIKETEHFYFVKGDYFNQRLSKYDAFRSKGAALRTLIDRRKAQATALERELEEARTAIEIAEQELASLPDENEIA